MQLEYVGLAIELASARSLIHFLLPFILIAHLCFLDISCSWLTNLNYHCLPFLHVLSSPLIIVSRSVGVTCNVFTWNKLWHLV